MDTSAICFLASLRARPEVLGIILFGSRARGNERSDSDYDLLVIVSDGYCRAVEHHAGAVFEIIYVTEVSAYSYWENNLDDAAGLWEVAQVLFDRDGTVARLAEKVRTVLANGKPSLGSAQLGQLRFDAEDQVRYAERVAATDPTTANLMLSNKVFTLTGVFFDVRKEWTPPPKLRMAAIRELRPELYALLESFYLDGSRFDARVRTAQQIISVIFDI